MHRYWTVLLACLLALGAPAGEKLAEGTPTAEQLGWRFSVQCLVDDKFTFFEAVDKVASLGLKCIEARPGETISKEHQDWKMGTALSDEAKTAVKKKLEEAGVKLISFGPVEIAGDEEGARRVFAFAKELGIESIMAQPEQAQLPMLDMLAQEYNVNVALYNYLRNSRYWSPDIVLEACKGRSKHVGACADTCSWVRSRLNPIECLMKLEGRIIFLRFKDLNDKDVPLATGAGRSDVKALLTEVKRQGLKAVFVAEYFDSWDRSLPEIVECMKNFEAIAKELK